MNIKSASVTSDSGYRFLTIDLGDGKEQIYDQDIALPVLKAGYAPIDEGGGSYEIEVDGKPTTMNDLTDNVQMVELAKRFVAGLLPAEGEVAIPTRDESLAAEWEFDIDGGKLTKLA